MMMTMKMKMLRLCWWVKEVVLLVVVLELGAQVKVSGQQSYVNNHQLDCYKHFNSTDGFVCDGVSSSASTCSSFLTFRSIPPYDSPVSIAYLLSSDASLIASANNFSSDVDPIPSDTFVLVPVNCSCVPLLFFQHNSSYSLKSSDETYFSVANNTFQGLTTCQALMAQNPSIGDRNLSVHKTLQIPLRCACPSPNQTAFGVKYLVSYLVTWGDDISSIAVRFDVDSQSLLDANMLSSSDIIFPFTPLLVPLPTDPSAVRLNQSPSPPTPPPSPQTTAGGQSNSTDSKKWVFVGIGTSAAVLLLLGLSAFIFCFLRRRTRSKDYAAKHESNPNANPLPVSTSSDPDHSPLPDSKSSWSISSGGVQSAIDSLTLYDIKEVQKATNFFSQANKIRGSVYRGSFKGDDAAIKVMKGDVSAEINILKRISHSNVIRLSGFCVHGGNTYLVYEYAESGSLDQCLQLQPQPYSSHSTTLSWKQRVEIAHDVGDALNYLHNFADPPYIHKNLKSSNILLDGNLRAKVSNFGLARVVGNGKDEGLQLTRHVVGTQGYLAPEYIEHGVITPKMDVFAFGVVMLELLSGKEAAATNKNKNNDNKEELLFDTIKRVLEGDNVREKLRGFIDLALRQQDYPLDLAFSMAQLANLCVAQDLNSRPDIAQVFVTLSKIRSSTHDWDPSDELQRSSSLTQAR
ncbi:hypothetical protein TIFTF001_004777 [Ficus carica]|uniref:Uncharacterized protein n=1 Tax=Ficus carica TaxID=3494 RepID=A0AA87ZHC9_FICCA|nr:hypothetical protein TIFTF001_004777 [Ficus carica]